MASTASAIGGSLSLRSPTPSFFATVTECMHHILPADDTMKVLLVDEHTLHILSVALTQTMLLQRGVLLVDHVAHTRPRRAMKSLRCVIFVRPQRTSVEAACAELRRARYQRYTIAFSAATTPEQLEQLARADADGACASTDGVAATIVDGSGSGVGGGHTSVDHHHVGSNRYRRLHNNNDDDDDDDRHSGRSHANSSRSHANYNGHDRRDGDGLVDRVVEVFCDACAVNEDAYLLEVTPAHALLSSHMTHSQIRRIAEGLAATMVARRCRPHVRFLRHSGFAQRVASALMDILHGDAELYNYRSHDTVLLLLDRCADPLTPLLTPWTYQAMLHEHIGLQHNTLRLPPDALATTNNNNNNNNNNSSNDSTTTAGDDGYVFAPHDDRFYADNLYSDWGEVCNHVKAYVEQCKAALHMNRTTATMDDLRAFVQNMPQARHLTGSVAKHTTVTTYLASVIQRRDLLQVALLEQDMAGVSNQSEHWTRLQALAARRDVTSRDVLRLCLIYHLRYERAAQAQTVTTTTTTTGSSGSSSSTAGATCASRTAALLDRHDPTYTTWLRKLRAYYGVERSTDALFATTGVMAALVKTFIDTGNLYTQHEPLLKRTLLQLFSGKLDLESHPYASSPPSSNVPATPLQPACFKPREVMVYMCGGYTFAEAALVHAVNRNTAYKPADVSSFLGGGGGGVRATIGGEATLNTSMFLDLLAQVP